MDKRKKVVFFVNDLNSGGIENYLLRFLKYKGSSFDEVVIYCKNGTRGQLEQEYLSIENVTIADRKISFFNPLDYIKLRGFLRAGNFDVVCDFTGNFAGLVVRQSRKAGVPKRIVFYRGSTNRFKSGKLKDLYNTYLNYLVQVHATNILSNSKAAFDFFFTDKWKKNKKFEVIYNGIDPKYFLDEKEDLRREFKIPSNAFVIGHTGRFNRAKNHKTIIEVAEYLTSKYDDIYFVLCGNGVNSNLQSYLTQHKLENRILTFENRKDIPKFLNTMNFFVFPSITEGQPNSLLEAMMMKLPFVASNIDPIKETVGEANFDRLFEPLDTQSYKDFVEKAYLQKEAYSLKNRDYVLNNFNHKILFDKFYNVLNNHSI